MAKISNLIAYPTVTPTLGDYVVGTDISDGNATVNYSFQSIADIMPTPTLEEVLAEGNTATNNIILTGNISISGTYGDTSGDVGTAGQVLSSTGAGTNWVDNVDGSGTLNTVAKWTPDGNTLGDSNITDNGTTINITSSASYFEVRASGGSEFQTNVLFTARATTENILHIDDGLEDGLANAGGSGQILSSTSTGVLWIDQLPSGLVYKGTWDALTNASADGPLASGVGTPGNYYIVKIAGTTNLDGNNTWEIGDWAVFSSTNVWQEIDNQNIFSGSGTANTMTKWTGTQSLGDSNITDNGTTIDIGDSTATTVAFSNTGNAEVAASVGTWRFNNTDVSFSPGVQLMDASAGPGTAGQVLSSTGAQVLWTDTVDGSGTLNTIPKWTPDTDTLGDSNITDDGATITLTSTSVDINTTNTTITPSNLFVVSGDSELRGDIQIGDALATEECILMTKTFVENGTYLRINGELRDAGDSMGVAGQILSSTGTTVDWINAPSSTVGPDGSRSVSGTILSAALLTIGATPVELVPAPGAAKLIVVDSVYLFNDYGTVPYTNVGGVSGLFYSTSLTSSDKITQVSTSFYTATSDNRRMYHPWYQLNLIINDSIVLGNTTATNLTTGDGNFYFTVNYKILNAADMTPVLT